MGSQELDNKQLQDELLPNFPQCWCGSPHSKCLCSPYRKHSGLGDRNNNCPHSHTDLCLDCNWLAGKDWGHCWWRTSGSQIKERKERSYSTGGFQCGGFGRDGAGGMLQKSYLCSIFWPAHQLKD